MKGMAGDSLDSYPGRAGLQQRVLPAYRTSLLEGIAASCQGGLCVFAGKAGPEESIASLGQLEIARFESARNFQIVPAASPLYLLWQTNILRWLSEWDPDVLILEANARYLSNRAAIRWMHVRGRPVIGWGLGAPEMGGGDLLERLINGILERSRKRFLLSCDALISYSQAGAHEYRMLGFPEDCIFIAPNAVASRPAKPPVEKPAEFGERPILLFVGRLQKRKRIDNLLLACSGFPEKERPEVYIVGDGPAREEFQQLANSIYPRAKFFGELRGPQLSSLFSAADLFVLPGTGGLAVQEAMAHGLPVVVAAGDGTQNDLVRHGNGWLVPPGNPKRLEQALKEALADPARLRQMGAESYRIVREEVNLEAMVSVFVRALSSVGVGREVDR
jgi:glycosyltransferase involved in cell wall biosynthesis